MALLAKVRALPGCCRCFWQGSALAVRTEVPAGPAHSGRAGSARSCQTCTEWPLGCGTSSSKQDLTDLTQSCCAFLLHTDWEQGWGELALMDAWDACGL